MNIVSTTIKNSFRKNGFIVRNYHYIIIGIVLGVAIMANFYSGQFVFSNDNYSPELNSKMYLERTLQSPSLRTYRSLGVPSDSEQADSVRTLFYISFEKFFPKWSISQVYSMLCLIVGTISMGLLTQSILRNSKVNNLQPLAFLFGSLFYLTTLWTAWVYNYSMMPYITQFGFLPLVLLGTLLYTRKPSLGRAFFLFVASLFFLATSVISTLFFVAMFLIIGFTLYCTFFEVDKGKACFTDRVWIAFISLTMIVVPNLIWLFPFSAYVTNSSGDVIKSSFNRSITQSTIDMEQAKLTAANSANFYTRVLDVKDANEGDAFLFEPANKYNTVELYRVISFFPLAFFLIGFYYSLINKDYKILFVIGFGIFAWFGMKNTNPPLGFVFRFFQDNFSIFRQIFRWPSSKFGQIFLIPLTIVATYGLLSLLRFVEDIKVGKSVTFFKGLLLFIVLSSLLFYGGYIFTGNLYPKRAITEFPQYYFDLENYLVDNDPEGRILLLPPPNNGYFREHDWGFIGSGFLQYLLPNPILDLSMALGSWQSELATHRLTHSYFSDEEYFDRYLDSYEVEYMLLDRSLIKGRYGYEIDWNHAESMLANYNLIWTQGDLELYSVSSFSNKSNIKYREVSSINNSLYGEKGNFILSSSVNPAILPLFLNYTAMELTSSEIILQQPYSGMPITVTPNISLSILKDSPTKIKMTKDGKQLILEPAIPLLTGVDTIEIPSRRFNKASSDAFVSIGNNIVDIRDYENEIVVINRFGSIGDFVNIFTNTFQLRNLLEDYSKSDRNDCSDLEINNTVKVDSDGEKVRLSAGKGVGCLYADLTNYSTKDNVLELNLSFYADEGTITGLCLWSGQDERCLNENKYYYSTSLEEDIEINEVIDTIIPPGKELSLIIYIYAKDGQKRETVFQRADVKIYSDSKHSFVQDQNDSYRFNSLLISSGDIIEARIPRISGENTYSYVISKNSIWEPSEDSAKCLSTSKCNLIYTKGGLFPEIEQNSFSQFVTFGGIRSNDWNFIIWEGENKSNIPAYLCLAQGEDWRCHFEDTFFESQPTTQLGYIHPTNASMTASIFSNSFSAKTENLLTNFIVQPIPLAWSELAFTSGTNTALENYKMDLLQEDRIWSTNFVLSVPSDAQFLASLPYESNDGWMLFSVEDKEKYLKGSEITRTLRLLLFENQITSDKKAIIDDWRQGWLIDKNDLEEDNFLIAVYIPNLWAKLGFVYLLVTILILIIIVGVNLVSKFIKNEKR